MTCDSSRFEERFDALLHLDRDGEVVAELDGLVRRFPVRERLVVQLMRGLYRSGRQSEALAVYRQLRGRLVDELGVEPSEPAQELHRQVLAHDPALGPSRVATGGNLPRRVTSFVGRDAELARVAAATGCSPLVTLTGVGGVGKSRLALEIADRDRARFPDGVWLCELAPLADTGPVSHAVAAALGVQQRHGLSIEQTVIEYLRARTLLLVLDNCEHVLPAAARLVGDVVAHCAGVVVLATSREALGVDGEQVWPVPPLSVSDASALFVHRARSTRPDFDPDREVGGAVAEICLRLDGLPLAIELAAARMRMMSASELGQRLDDSQLLVGGPRTAQPRHQSLTAAIDWSYRLLSRPEQSLFARMSVFAGGAELDAVHGVCAEPEATDIEVLALLTRLVDKSMVVATPGCAGTRYRMLETVRAHGRERLRERGDDVALARRHAAYVTELAERAARGVQGPDEQAWVERTLPDRDNLRVAFEQAFADRNGDLALRLVSSLAEVLHLRVGYESAAWAERALDIAPAEHPLRAAARGAWARVTSPALARWPPGRVAGSRPGEPPASPIPPTSSQTSPCTSPTSTPHCGTGRPRCSPLAATTTRSGWSGRCTTSPSATPCAGNPGSGSRPRGSRCRWQTGPATRRRDRWPVTRSAWSARRPIRTARWRCSTRPPSWPRRCTTSGGTG
jgi:predicted ATPase